MKSVFFSVSICAFLVVLAFNSFSANPADLTSNHRTFVSEFFKIGYDGGPRFLCFNLPAGKTASVCVFNWQDKKSDNSFSELYIAKSMAPWLDVTLDSILAGGAPVHNLAVDIRYKPAKNIEAGLGLITPLSFKNMSFGPRISVKNISVFLAVPTAKDASNFYGISYKFFGINAEGAYGAEKVFLRASKAFPVSFGILIPELRTSFSEKEKIYGFALGFIPKP
ncbi:MAG: hypothetical protein PHY72_00055 [Candidatus Pacebacteria bacterium]|nr:hypothetical protein [Candidatus Paceibacterota bacterium]